MGHPEIPWREIMGMRHKIAHDYFEVDFQTVWDTVKADLSPLEKQITQILRKEFPA
jgi:uncharacterized protein with HEPN domain